MNQNMNHDHVVDIKGMCCGAPIQALNRAFRAYSAGEVALVVSDKISMLKDIPSYCILTRNELLEQDQQDGLYRFWIRKQPGREAS